VQLLWHPRVFRALRIHSKRSARAAPAVLMRWSERNPENRGFVTALLEKLAAATRGSSKMDK